MPKFKNKHGSIHTNIFVVAEQLQKFHRKHDYKQNKYEGIVKYYERIKLKC